MLAELSLIAFFRRSACGAATLAGIICAGRRTPSKATFAVDRGTAPPPSAVGPRDHRIRLIQMLQLTATAEDGIVSIRRADGVGIDSACEAGGEVFSASELLAASLASCVAASLLPILARHALDVRALHVRVSPDGATVGDGLTVTVTLPPCDEGIRTRCRRAAETCPVRQALNLPLEFHWQTG